MGGAALTARIAHLADNTIRGGSVIEPEDELARATQKFNETLANDPRLSVLILPLIRQRVDGLAVARVLDYGS